MLRERRPAPTFRGRSERAFVSGCYGRCFARDRRVPDTRPRRGVAPASRRRTRGGDRRGTAPARLNPKGRRRVRIQRVRMRAPVGRDFDDEAQEAVGRVRRVRRDRRPCRGGPRRRRAPPRLRSRPHSPVASALARRQAEHDVLRLARRKARVGHRHVRRAYVHRLQTWSLARLRRERRSLRADIRALRRTGGAPDVPVPGRPAVDRRVRVGRQPARRRRRRRVPRQVPVRLRHVGARRRQRRPGRGARGRAGPPRGHALRPRRRVAVARLRPVDSLPRVDASALRAEFPVLEDRAYLNAGTCGPLPHASVRADPGHARPRRCARAREGVRRDAPRAARPPARGLRGRCSGPRSPTSR